MAKQVSSHMALTIEQLKDFIVKINKAIDDGDFRLEVLKRAFMSLIESFYNPDISKDILKPQDLNTDLFKDLELMSDTVEDLKFALENGGAALKDLISQHCEISFSKTAIHYLGVNNNVKIIMQLLGGKKILDSELLKKKREQYYQEKSSKAIFAQNENNSQVSIQENLENSVLTIEQLEDIVKEIYKNLKEHSDIFLGLKYLIASFFDPNEENVEKRLTFKSLEQGQTSLKIKGHAVANLNASLREHPNGSEIKELIIKKHNIEFKENKNFKNESVILNLLAGEELTERDRNDLDKIVKKSKDDQQGVTSETEIRITNIDISNVTIPPPAKNFKGASVTFRVSAEPSQPLPVLQNIFLLSTSSSALISDRLRVPSVTFPVPDSADPMRSTEAQKKNDEPINMTCDPEEADSNISAQNNVMEKNNSSAQINSAPNSSNTNYMSLPESGNTEASNQYLKLEIKHLKHIVKKINNISSRSENAYIKLELLQAFRSLFKSFFRYDNVSAEGQAILNAELLEKYREFLVETGNTEDQSSFDALILSLRRDEKGIELEKLISDIYEISFRTFGKSQNVSVIMDLLCDKKMAGKEENADHPYEILRALYLSDQSINEHNSMFLRHVVPVKKQEDSQKDSSAPADSSSAEGILVVNIQENSKPKDVLATSPGALESVEKAQEAILVSGNDNARDPEAQKENPKLSIADIVDFYRKLNITKQRNSNIKIIYDAFKKLIQSFFEKDNLKVLTADILQEYEADLFNEKINTETIEALKNSLIKQPNGSEIQHLIFTEYGLSMPERMYPFSYATVICGLLEGELNYGLETFLNELRSTLLNQTAQHPSTAPVGEVHVANSSSLDFSETPDEQSLSPVNLPNQTPTNTGSFEFSSLVGLPNQATTNLYNLNLPAPVNLPNLSATNPSDTSSLTAVIAESKNLVNNSSTPKQFLVMLKEEVEKRDHWSTQGAGFFGRKTPKYINKLQTLMKNLDNIQEMEETLAESFTVKAVKELIYAKDHDSSNRKDGTRKTYQNYLIKGLDVLKTTESAFRMAQGINGSTAKTEESFRVSPMTSRFF